MRWLADEFGDAMLLRPIVRPADFIPADNDGSTEAARELFAKVCDRMDVEADRLDLRFDLDEVPPHLSPARLDQLTHQRVSEVVKGRFGQWREGEDRNLVLVAAGLLAQPEVLVAVFAHEVGHEALLGAGRIDRYRRDQEALTDLFAVFAGFGILMANSAHAPLPEGLEGGNAPRFYLREHALSDALAYYASLREERTLPSWAKHLDWPVRIRAMSRLSKLEEAAQGGK
ncbi:hypothetical protein [Kribbella sancticallisti]